MTGDNRRSSKDAPSSADSPRKARCRSSISRPSTTVKRTPLSLFLYESLSSLARLCRYLLLAVILALLILTLLYYWMQMENPVSSFLHPSDETSKQTYLWKTPTGVGGLQLMMENALDRQWTLLFDEYVVRWSAGYDSIVPLSLQVERVAFDPLCKPTMGRLKVCNGNYGDTGWRGINIALTDSDNLIQHSVVKFNDYYTMMNKDDMPPWKAIKYTDFWGQLHDEGQLKYTMCHELGHGFGLPHSDENMWNRNTGECMDYTRFPRRNLAPGKRNFDILYQLYGSVPNEQRKTTTNNLRRRLLVERSLSEQILDEYERTIQSAVEDRSCMECQIQLSDGFQLTIHKLPLAPETLHP